MEVAGETGDGGQILDPACPYLSLQSESTDDFTQEGCLFPLGFGQRYAPMGVQKLDGQPGESGSGAEVEQGWGGWGPGFRLGIGLDIEPWLQVHAGEEALTKVAADHLFGGADGGEVGSGVPAEQQVEVYRETVVEFLGRRSSAEVGLKERGDAARGKGLGGWLAEASGHRLG